MTKDKDPQNSYENHSRPFELLQMHTSEKTLAELYLELVHRAEEEFLEHCYRSKKNYTPGMFKRTEFFRRYSFLRYHLEKLVFWLYLKMEFIPEDLFIAMKKRPRLVNPWGVKMVSRKLSIKPLFGKDRF